METFLKDLRYGIRTLARRPGITVLAALALALGIGANTAVFSVIRGVLLRPLPYADPDRLVVIWESNLAANAPRESTSAPNYYDWKAQNQVFESMAARAGWLANLTGEGEPEQITGQVVTANFFSMLGVQPAIGRVFSEDEKNSVLLSHSLWERRFGRDPNISGRKIVLSDAAYTIIGVMPEWFRAPNIEHSSRPPELWRTEVFANNPNARRGDFLRVYARLKPGVSLEQARAGMGVVAERLARQYPDANRAWTVETHRLSDAMTGNVRESLWLLLGSAGLLLGIACANIANLLLARASERRKEFAIRSALGGGRRRLFVQVLTESLLLSLLGSAIGVVLAAWAVKLAVTFGAAYIPRADAIALDGWVLAFTAAVACITAVIFGSLPARQAASADLNDALKAGGRGATLWQGRSRAVLVAAEVALTMVLLVAAGLLLRTFWSLQNVPLGFDPKNVLTAQYRPAPGPNRPAMVNEFIRRVASLPGVQAVGAINALPLSGGGNEFDFALEGKPDPPPDVVRDAFVSAVTPDYFRAMGIRLARGRWFTPADTADSPLVAVVSEGFAARHYPNEDPIGQRLSFEGPKRFRQIVGIVKNVHHEGLAIEPKGHIYAPYPQFAIGLVTLVVRSAGDPMALVPAVRAELRAMDPVRPLTNIRTAEAVFDAFLAERRFALGLLAGFAGLALLLASVGIFGVISYAVTQRTQEIGVRMALGATRPDVLRMILRQGLIMTGAGLIVGSAVALAVTRLLASFLYGVKSNDAATFAGVIAIFTLMALAASTIPALRATRVDPLEALRYE